MAGGAKGLAGVIMTLPFAALLLSSAIVLPAAYGQQQSSSSSSASLAVTTNKSVYDPSDRVIVAGTVGASDDDGGNNNDYDRARFVTVRVAKDDDDGAAAAAICGQQFIRVDRDGSFISRSMKVSCGPGNYTVTATYGALSATASFRIVDEEAAASSPALSDESGSIRDAVVQARDRVSTRIRELVQANITLPEQAVEKYRLGASEASLAIQFAEYGETGDARRHMDAALAYFAEAQDLLSPANLRALSQPAAGDDDGEERRLAAAIDRYGRLADIYPTLAGLAQKNGISDAIFDDIQSLLVEAKRLIDMRDLGSAESTLAVTELVVDRARAKLVDQAGNNNSDDDGNDDSGVAGGNGSRDDANSNNNDDASGNNSAAASSSSDDSQKARSLSASADRLEKRAEKELADAGDNVPAQQQIHEAMNLIYKAKAAIADGDYQSARDSLSAASHALMDAARLSRG